MSLLAHPPPTSAKSEMSEPTLLTALHTNPAPSASSANTTTDNTITPKITAKIEVLTTNGITYHTLLDFTALSCIFSSIMESL